VEILRTRARKMLNEPELTATIFSKAWRRGLQLSRAT
jgi:hypothetical protein